MRNGKPLDLLCNVFLPILLGVGIYKLSYCYGFTKLLTNYLPDGLWAYAFLSALLFIWDRQINKVWILLAFGIAIGFELLQYLQVLGGTGDFFDIVVYSLSFTVVLLLNNFFKTKFLYQTQTVI
jgi:hypothetical protein